MSAKWQKIKIGDQASFTVIVTEEMVSNFMKITGDDNPLHVDELFAQAKGFSKKVAHGMLLAALFSRLVGKYFLGDNNLYLAQNMEFKKPVLINEEVNVSGIVIEKIESIKTLVIKTTISRADGAIAVAGQAIVKYL